MRATQDEQMPASAAPQHSTTQKSPRGKATPSSASGNGALPAEGTAPPAAGNGSGWRGSASPQSVSGAPTLRSIVQPKLVFGSPGDRFEQEADAIAERVTADGNTAMTAPTPAQPTPVQPASNAMAQAKCAECEKKEDDEKKHLQRKEIGSATAAGSAAAGADPGGIENRLGRGGATLPGPSRSFYENRMGADFSQVRIHNDTESAAMNRSLGARAFTHGSHIYFNRGEYAPASHEGKKLIAHELAHTMQQGAAGSLRMKREDDDGKHTKPVGRPYKVRITKPLKQAELADELMRQYPEVGKFTWRYFAPVTAAQVRQGYCWIWVTDESIASFTPDEEKKIGEREKKLSKSGRKAIDDEAYERFWKKTGYRRGHRLGNAGDDATMAKYLEGIRKDVLRERVKIDALPPLVRAVIMDDHRAATLDPRDYEKVLSIAKQLSTLSPEELAEYKSRTTVETTDVGEMEKSVQAFLTERRQRQADEAERRKAGTRLYGLETLYKLYKEFVPYRYEYANDAAKHGAQKGVRDTRGTWILEKGDAFEDALHAAGFSDIDEFKTTVDNYEKAFRNEAVALTYEVLDQYRHSLQHERERYSNPEKLQELMQAVTGTGARDKYSPFGTSAASHPTEKHAGNVPPGRSMQTPHTQDVLAPDPKVTTRAMFNLAESDVKALSYKYPILGDRDFPRASLAMATEPDAARKVIDDYVAGRIQSIENTRSDIEGDNEKVYLLDALIKLAEKRQGIASGTVLAAIVDDEISVAKTKKFIKDLFLGIIAIAVSLAGPIGQIVAFGISAYMAADQYQNYLSDSDAHAVGLLTENPNVAWVVIAVVGAGIDLVFLAKSAKVLEPVVEAFEVGDEAGNLTQLESKLNELTEVDKEVRTAIIRAATARLERQAAWKAVGARSGNLFADLTGGIGETVRRLVPAVYYTMKSGVREFQVFLKTKEALELIGDVAKLTGRELNELKEAYLQTVEDVTGIVAHGKTLGITDEEIEGFVRIRMASADKTLDDVKAEMSLRHGDSGSHGDADIEQTGKSHGDQERNQSDDRPRIPESSGGNKQWVRGAGIIKGMEVDPSKVFVFRGGPTISIEVRHVRIQNGLVQTTHGASLWSIPEKVENFGGSFEVESLPDELKIIQRGDNLEHFEIVPREPMVFEKYQKLLNEVKLKPYAKDAR
ncbi:MAG: DUF4157 domain-containing protein [Bacteroidetes bacterium]|nr:DUF4157 domain-containing protein [Bacteroidota bacterium]